MEHVEKNDPSYPLIVQETDLLGDSLYMEVLHLKNEKGDQLTRYFGTSR